MQKYPPRSLNNFNPLIVENSLTLTSVQENKPMVSILGYWSVDRDHSQLLSSAHITLTMQSRWTFRNLWHMNTYWFCILAPRYHTYNFSPLSLNLLLHRCEDWAKIDRLRCEKSNCHLGYLRRSETPGLQYKSESRFWSVGHFLTTLIYGLENTKSF